MTAEVGQKDALDCSYCCESLDLDKCALRNPGSSHVECSSQSWYYWKHRARFICFLDTPHEALGKNKAQTLRELSWRRPVGQLQEQEGALLEVTPLDWQGGRTGNR